jgi:hypothetical protein
LSQFVSIFLELTGPRFILAASGTGRFQFILYRLETLLHLRVFIAETGDNLHGARDALFEVLK